MKIFFDFCYGDKKLEKVGLLLLIIGDNGFKNLYFIVQHIVSWLK